VDGNVEAGTRRIRRKDAGHPMIFDEEVTFASDSMIKENRRLIQKTFEQISLAFFEQSI
jgi:hypothetical protein